MRVLVTGGSGFLGTAVVAALAGAEAGKRAADVVVSGDIRLPDESSRVPGVVYEISDVTDGAGLTELIRTHRVDTVVHLASIVNPGRGAEAESLEYWVDVIGSRAVLDACVATGVRRLVVSSSGAAYGYHRDNPVWLRESDALRGNDTFSYSRNKRLVEEMLAEAREEHPELEQVIFRIGTILGPTVHNQITALFDAPRLLAVRGSESPFVFAWVSDVVACMVRAATNPEAPPGIYNLAGDGAVTVSQLAASMGKKTLTVPAWLLKTALWVGRLLHLTVHGPARVGFLQYRPVLSNTALTTVFGYTPEYTSRQVFDAYRKASAG